MNPTITRSTEIAAPADLVWSIVTDLPGMGSYSPENVGGHWVDGATGPALGARFVGTNRNGRLQWWTRVRVVAYEPGRLFTFDVRTPFGIRVSRWSYQLTPTDEGCVLHEHWYRVGTYVVRRFIGPRITGRADRPGFNVVSIEHTLAAIKAHAEAVTRSAQDGISR